MVWKFKHVFLKHWLICSIFLQKQLWLRLLFHKKYLIFRYAKFVMLARRKNNRKLEGRDDRFKCSIPSFSRTCQFMLTVLGFLIPYYTIRHVIVQEFLYFISEFLPCFLFWIQQCKNFSLVNLSGDTGNQVLLNFFKLFPMCRPLGNFCVITALHLYFCPKETR